MPYNPTVCEGSSAEVVYVWACATDANRHTHTKSQQVQSLQRTTLQKNLLGVLRSAIKDAGMGTFKSKETEGAQDTRQTQNTVD